MSNLFTQPWSTSEKIVLLTNIIQGAGNDVPMYLLQNILENNIQPKWPDMALPEGTCTASRCRWRSDGRVELRAHDPLHISVPVMPPAGGNLLTSSGRSLHACQQFYDDMVRALRQPRSFSAMGPTGYAQPPLLAPQPSSTRAVSEHEYNPPTQRAIQPRPPRTTDSPLPTTTNGEAFTILRPFAPELGVERRRKRGRPTKEEAEERDRRLAATGQTYEPKKRPAKKPRPSDTPHSLAEALSSRSPGVETPSVTRTDPQEETSSGKRRRRYQHYEDSSQGPHPKSPLEDSGNERSIDVAQSPSDRLLLRSNERTQAVTSVARDIHQQDPSPQLKQEPDQRQEEAVSASPSV